MFREKCVYHETKPRFPLTHMHVKSERERESEEKVLPFSNHLRNFALMSLRSAYFPIRSTNTEKRGDFFFSKIW